MKSDDIKLTFIDILRLDKVISEMLRNFSFQSPQFFVKALSVSAVTVTTIKQ